MKLKNIFSPDKQMQIPNSIPEHLVPVYYGTKFAEKSNEFLDKFYEEHAVIDVKSPYELFVKMMNE